MTTEQNKAIVTRFNRECIEQTNPASFKEILAADCINHAAPPGTPNGAESMINFLSNVLKPGFPDLKVAILDQVAEGDKVVTRKEIRGTHTGSFMGVAPSNKTVLIKVIDIIRLRNGQYVDHWAASNLHEVLAEIGAK